MTLVLLWLDKQNDSLYIASDSRLSAGGVLNWDHATKIFRAYPTHEYMAYTGRSLLAATAVHQGIALLQQTDNLMKSGTKSDPDPDARLKAMHNHLRDIFSDYPWKPGENATVLYAGYAPRSECFRVYQIEISKELPNATSMELTPGRVFAFGSGKDAANKMLGVSEPDNADQVYAILRSVIEDPDIAEVGGPPQMIRIGKDSSTAIGFNWLVYDQIESTIFGMPISFHSDMSKVEFRNADFSLSRNCRSGRVRAVGREIQPPQR